MKRFIFAVAASYLAFAGVRLHADEVVRCESHGRYTECSYETEGRVKLRRTLGSRECIEGETWGYDEDTIWVDKGCRADFVVVSEGVRATEGGPASEGTGRSWGEEGRDRDRNTDRRGGSARGYRLFCESDGNHERRCSARVPYDVELLRQIGSNCVRDETWGYDEHSIWVSGGCRGEFWVQGDDTDRNPYGDRGGEYGWEQGQYRTITCESKNERREFCRADTSFGVRLTRQRSLSDCIYDKSWGYDDRGIWVSDGCRADFAFRIR